jgi:hypothetical protein
MEFDPTQPMIFDTESSPGRGSGYWYVNPFSSTGSRDNASSGGVGGLIVFFIALAGIVAGGAHMLLTGG